MLSQALQLGSTGFRLDDITFEGQMITLTVSSVQRKAACPECQHPAERVHSQYWRTAADLPLGGLVVRLHLLVHRYFCDNRACKRRTFAERFPAFLAVYARRTLRLAAQQHQVGLSLGGQGAAKLLGCLAMPTSADTVLRLVKNTPAQAAATPRVLGVDDWAWAKGQRYGTILVDLEQHCVVDLLPDRSPETLAAWLRAHPGIEIISRDRGLEYIKGIEQGAPCAVEVADRWHLLRNLADALIRLLDQNQACLYAVASEPTAKPATISEPPPAGPEPESDTSRAPTKLEQRQQEARERRLARYQAVLDLHEQGAKSRAIARQLGLSRSTVRRYLKAGGFPERSKRGGQSSLLDSYLPYLEQRWDEGCHNGVQLYREIQQVGYSGSRPTVSRWVAKMRRQTPGRKGPEQPSAQLKKVTRPWSARYAVWLLLKEPEGLEPDKRAALERMLDASPGLRPAYNFAQAFLRMVRHREAKGLRPWLDAVIEYKIPELSGFAKSLERDFNAVYAALSLPWSNGQVEGQVNRLKMIKRQMYGRAGFNLLRQRVLAS